MPTDLALDDDEDTVRRRRAARASLTLEWSGHSSIGHRRKENQDAWGERDGARFVVADGVGGILGGAAASTAAVANFLAPSTPDDWSARIRDIDTAVLVACAANEHAGAATTLVGLDITQNKATLVHVGDSRAYLLRDRSLLCLTEDHNVANLRRLEGQDPRVGDRRGKPRSLTSYLGAGDRNLVVGVSTFVLKPGDRLLLCSDGIHEQLSPAHMVDLLGSLAVRYSARALVEAADGAGGRDNATAIVIEAVHS